MKENNIDYGLLDNVKQPKLAQTLIKLREVFVEYMNETDRVNDKYGCICGQLSDNFINEYNKLTEIIWSTTLRLPGCQQEYRLHLQHLGISRSCR